MSSTFVTLNLYYLCDFIHLQSSPHFSRDVQQHMLYTLINIFFNMCNIKYMSHMQIFPILKIQKNWFFFLQRVYVLHFATFHFRLRLHILSVKTTFFNFSFFVWVLNFHYFSKTFLLFKSIWELLTSCFRNGWLDRRHLLWPINTFFLSCLNYTDCVFSSHIGHA